MSKAYTAVHILFEPVVKSYETEKEVLRSLERPKLK